MFEKKDIILVLAPHPDDAEFGLGGTLSKFIKQGKEIHIAIFSMCEKSTPKGLHKGIIEEELLISMKRMNIPKENLHKFDFEVRKFPEFRQDILEEIIVLRNKIKPDLIFLPNSFDIHQDHSTIHIEGIRAFKHSSILGYEMPWNNFSVKTDIFVSLTEDDFENKIQFLESYQSQKSRSYCQFDFVKSLAILRGTQIQKPLAESFELIRFID